MDRKDIFVIQGNQYKEMAVRVLEAAGWQRTLETAADASA